MRWLFLLLISALLIQPVAAQTALERIEPRLSRAIDEHRVFLTCSSLDEATSASVQKGWAQMVGRARAYLSARYTSLADLEAFDARTRIDALIPMGTPLREVIAFCAAHADWSRKLGLLEFVYTIDDTPLP